MAEGVTEVRYLTDNRDDEGELLELVIQIGGNGDFYVAVVPQGHRPFQAVRISTSGGAQMAAPGMVAALRALFEAMRQAQSDGREK